MNVFIRGISQAKNLASLIVSQIYKSLNPEADVTLPSA